MQKFKSTSHPKTCSPVLLLDTLAVTATLYHTSQCYMAASDCAGLIVHNGLYNTHCRPITYKVRWGVRLGLDSFNIVLVSVLIFTR